MPLVWIVPAVTALIALWLAWDTYSKRGPTITVSFDSAGGLTAGQSQLKFKDVPMGTVKRVDIAPDLKKVVVTIETKREAEPLLTDKTIFWVVKPQLFAGRVSGLEPLDRQGKRGLELLGHFEGCGGSGSAWRAGGRERR